MRKSQLIAALGMASLALGNACTSAANGNWNATASWSNCGSGVPGDGDTVTITHNIIVTANATVGNSPLDTTASIPSLPVIQLNRTNGSTSNGQLTINGGVTFTVKGSVATTGTNGSYAPIITLQPGSTWTFDNSANPTAVYRIYGTVAQAFTYINAPGVGWGTGQYVIINGRPPSCSGCTGAVWTTESNAIVGGHYNTIRQNYTYTAFWYLGSPTDTYRGMYSSCYDGDHQANQQFYMIHVEWHNSPGWQAGGSTGYPCGYTDYKIQYFRSLDSTTASGKGFYSTALNSVVSAPASGKNRILQYAYFDTGFDSNGGNATLAGFQTVSYLVMDNQSSVFGPTSNALPGVLPNVDHMLVRETKRGAGNWAFGSTSYLLDVLDGGIGNQHSISTQKFNTGTYNWVMDHVIWQDGETASSDTDAIEARPYGVDGFTTTWNYLLMLPNAAQPQYTSHTVGAYQYTATSSAVYNHAVFSFGKNYGGTGGMVGSIYTGETDCGVAGTIGVKNSILWNPNPGAGESPLYAWVNGRCALNTHVANVFDPTQIHHNLVWNYGTNSNRWTSAVSGCGGADCTSKGTPYDAPMTGTVPGAHDIYQAPAFVWQGQGITAPGAREWANIMHGADITTGETATEVHFATTFALFKNANIADTTTTAGMKGLIDEMFAWIYNEWASTNPALRLAGDDGSDIGAARITFLCPSAYPPADVSRCSGLAQAGRPSDIESSAYSAGNN
jgi:hypothetical protein